MDVLRRFMVLSVLLVLVANTAIAQKEGKAAIQSFQMTGEESSFRTGEKITAAVKVKNSADLQRTYFIGYSSIGPGGKAYSNGGKTGKNVNLKSGEVKEVKLSLEIKDVMEVGSYDLVTKVWTEKPDSGKATELAGKRLEEAFTRERKRKGRTAWFRHGAKEIAVEEGENFELFVNKKEAGIRDIQGWKLRIGSGTLEGERVYELDPASQSNPQGKKIVFNFEARLNEESRLKGSGAGFGRFERLELVKGQKTVTLGGDLALVVKNPVVGSQEDAFEELVKKTEIDRNLNPGVIAALARTPTDNLMTLDTSGMKVSEIIENARDRAFEKSDTRRKVQNLVDFNSNQGNWNLKDDRNPGQFQNPEPTQTLPGYYKTERGFIVQKGVPRKKCYLESSLKIPTGKGKIKSTYLPGSLESERVYGGYDLAERYLGSPESCPKELEKALYLIEKEIKQRESFCPEKLSENSCRNLKLEPMCRKIMKNGGRDSKAICGELLQKYDVKRKWTEDLTPIAAFHNQSIGAVQAEVNQEGVKPNWKWRLEIVSDEKGATVRKKTGSPGRIVFKHGYIPDGDRRSYTVRMVEKGGSKVFESEKVRADGQRLVKLGSEKVALGGKLSIIVRENLNRYADWKIRVESSSLDLNNRLKTGKNTGGLGKLLKPFGKETLKSYSRKGYSSKEKGGNPLVASFRPLGNKWIPFQDGGEYKVIIAKQSGTFQNIINLLPGFSPKIYDVEEFEVVRKISWRQYCISNRKRLKGVDSDNKLSAEERKKCIDQCYGSKAILNQGQVKLKKGNKKAIPADYSSSLNCVELVKDFCGSSDLMSYTGYRSVQGNEEPNTCTGNWDVPCNPENAGEKVLNYVCRNKNGYQWVRSGG